MGDETHGLEPRRHAGFEVRDARPAAPDPSLVRVSILAGGWALGYAIYRAYYGFGGTFGMFGVPASDAQWRSINLVAAGLLLGAAALPIIALRWWARPWPRRILLAVAWLIAVACVGHALINGILRILSLAGIHDLDYPIGFWLSIDRRAADLQDLLFNEPWFFIEGLLWAVIAWRVLGRTRARRWWGVSTAGGVVAATLFGLLSAFGLIGRLVIG
jgi:hypothetical protein